MSQALIQLGVADLGIVFAYLAALLVIGYALRRSKAAGAAEFLLASRGLTLPAYVGSLVATWYGGILGVTEISYRHGLVTWLTQGGFWYVSYLLFAAFLAGRLQRSQQMTLPDQIGLLHGETARRLAALLNLINTLPIAYLLSLGLLVHLVSGLPVWFGIVVGSSITVLYSTWGGFRAVVYTDLLQFVLMCLSVALMMIVSVTQLGGSEYLAGHLPAGHLELTSGMSGQEIVVWFLFALSTLVDPNFYQRCYAAKSPSVARLGILLAIGFWLLFDVCTTFGGIYARAALPGVDPRLAYPLLADRLLPPGVKGFFFSGLLATIMSTVDSYCFVGAMALSHDLRLVRTDPTSAAGEASTIRRTRLGIVLTTVMAMALAMVFEGSIKTVWKTLGSLSTSAMLVPMMFGMLGWRPRAAGVASMAAGGGATILWALLRRFGPGWAARVEAMACGLGSSLLAYVICALWGKR
jgi:SSS family solute:Na+ symporter